MAHNLFSCLFSRHGCPDCIKDRKSVNRLKNATAQELYESTLAKEQYLKDQGFNVKSVWLCRWDRKRRANPAIERLLKSFEILPVFDPRVALKGGRTEFACKYWKSLAPTDKVNYVDFTSL